MIQPVDFVVKTQTVAHVEALPGCHPKRWPLCDLCEQPIGAEPVVIGYPRPERCAFLVHEVCWQQCAARLGRLIEVYS